MHKLCVLKFKKLLKHLLWTYIGCTDLHHLMHATVFITSFVNVRVAPHPHAISLQVRCERTKEKN